ncbi:MAG TPA: porin family protein [Saprospiraceae bacterium]|nr:porin family protein [Saprospiraceae bacterium]
MKWPLTFSLALLLCLHYSTAQITFGAKAGINLANWTTRGHNTLTDFHAGALINFRMGESFSVEPELLYSGKGTDLNDFFPNNPMRFTVQYLSLPVMLGYQVGQATFRLGPEVSYFLNSSIEINSQMQDVDEAFKKWDIAITAGASLQIFSGLALEVRYLYGLQDVVELLFVDPNGLPLGTLDEGKNRVLQIGLRYQLNY